MGYDERVRIFPRLFAVSDAKSLIPLEGTGFLLKSRSCIVLRRVIENMRKIGLFLLLSLLLVGCTTPSPTPPVVTPAPPVTVVPPVTTEASVSFERSPGRVVISECIPGAPGNNNFEFIELYNAGTEPVDMRGWSLWYRMADTQEEKRLFLWTARTDIPGYGHYLLARVGQDVGTAPDAAFDVPLFERKGGLALRDADGTTGCWVGRCSGRLWRGRVHAFSRGRRESERAGWSGRKLDTGDNHADFSARAQPDPQNSGSPMAPCRKIAW